MQTLDWANVAVPSWVDDAAKASSRPVLFQVFVNWERTPGWTAYPVGGGHGNGPGQVPLDDITRYVTNVQIDRSLTTDVPLGTRLVTGQSVASLSLDLCGDPLAPDMPASMTWSRFSQTSPFTGKKRAGADIIFYGGYQNDDGDVVYWRAFTGKLRGIKLDAAGQVATLSALDSMDSLRGLINYPMIVANDQYGVADSRWGMNTQWMIDYGLRKQGIYGSPPPRTGTVASMTCHGSMYPEIGIPIRCQVWAFTPDSNDNYAFRQVLTKPAFEPINTEIRKRYSGQLCNQYAPGIDQGSIDYFAVPRLTIQPQVIAADGTAKGAPTIGPGTFNGVQFEWMQGYFAGVDGWKNTTSVHSQYQLSNSDNPQLDGSVVAFASAITLRLQDTGKWSVLIDTPGGRTTITDTVVMPPNGGGASNAWEQMSIHVLFNSATSVTVKWRNSSNAERSQTATLTGVFPTNPRMAYFNYISTGMPTADIMVTRTSAPDYSAMADVPYYATVKIDPGMNELGIVPFNHDSQKVVDVLTDVTAAEFGALWYDENGVLQFRNRDGLKKAHFDAVATGASSILNVTEEDTIDTVVNHVTAQATAYAVQPYEWIWSTGAKRGLHSFETQDLYIHLDNPCYGIPVGTTDPDDPHNGPFRFIPVGGADTSTWDSADDPDVYNGYRACRQPNGQGDPVRNLIWTVESFTDLVHIQVTNPNNYPVYLISPDRDFSGTGIPAGNIGQPCINLAGRPVVAATTVAGLGESGSDVSGLGSVTTQGTTLTSDSRDQGSIDEYGEQLLPLTASDYYQFPDSVQDICDDITAALAQPIPEIGELDVIGDWRYQLTDRYLVETSLVNGLSQDAYAVGISTTVSVDPQSTGAGGLSQVLSMKLAGPPGAWILDDADYTAPDGSHHASLSNLGVTTILV